MTKLHSLGILFLLLGLGQAACDEGQDGKAQGSALAGGSGGKSPAAGAAAARGGSSGTGSDAAVAESAEPGTFTHIYDMAFKTCRTQCHGMGYSMLDMKTRDMAYSQLVDHDSNPGNQKCAPLVLKRVKPGAPDESLLYLKLDIHAPCGQQMPPGGQLPQALRDEVRDWIMNGAKDD